MKPKTVKRKGGTRTKKNRNEAVYAKRPMNAFMLFAKRYRLEITQKHPGKDNRYRQGREKEILSGGPGYTN